MQLRGYQSDDIGSLRRNLASGTRSQILVAPTGAGKTVIASDIILRAVERGKRCLFLAHRKELINQCSDKLDECGVEHGVIKSGHWRLNPFADVQVASVQTLVRREHWEADVVIIDECHRSTANTYQEILARFTGQPAVIGLTATPYRQDGHGLGDMYSKIVVTTSAEGLVREGHLINPKVFASSNVDLSKLKVVRRGEYTDESASDAVADTVLRGEVVRNWKLHADDAATVCFAVNVAHSQEIVRQFNAAGVPARHLDGKTADKDREQILQDLRNRKIKVVSNVGVLCEGYDLPLLECVILARPTHSRSTWKQMVGRVMRPDPEKRMAIVLDHGGNTMRHGFVTDSETYSLDSGESVQRSSDAVPRQQIVVCPECSTYMRQNPCEHCGHEIVNSSVEVETAEELTAVSGSMQATQIDWTAERAAEAKKEKKNSPVRQRHYDALCMTCVMRKYKPGWVAHQFKHRFKSWPSGMTQPDFFKEYIEQRQAKSNNDKPNTTGHRRSSQVSRRTGTDGGWSF